MNDTICLEFPRLNRLNAFQWEIFPICKYRLQEVWIQATIMITLLIEGYKHLLMTLKTVMTTIIILIIRPQSKQFIRLKKYRNWNQKYQTWLILCKMQGDRDRMIQLLKLEMWDTWDTWLTSWKTPRRCTETLSSIVGSRGTCRLHNQSGRKKAFIRLTKREES